VNWYKDIGSRMCEDMEIAGFIDREPDIEKA
jgi:hypothetical protein